MAGKVPTNLDRVWAKLAAIKDASQRTWHAAARFTPDPKHFKDPLPETMFTFNGPTSLREVALMSDSDIGGSSSIALRLGEPDEAEESWAMKRTPFGVFQGHMSLAIREELEGKRRGGYVGWRTKPRVGVWGPHCYNLEFLTHLSIPIRPGGDPKLWPHWMLNLQTNGHLKESVWSHRLGITGKGDLGGGWEECIIPLHHLAHIHKGSLTDKQQLPEWDLVSTVGLSLLAAPRSDPDRLSPEAAERARRTPEGVEGEFELAVGPVRAIYKSPRLAGHHPAYYHPPSTLAFFPPPEPVPTRYPSFEEANYRSTLTPTFERGRYPALVDGRVFAGKAKGEGGAIEKARERTATEEEKQKTPSSSTSKVDKGEKDGPRRKNLGLDQAEVERKLERELGL